MNDRTSLTRDSATETYGYDLNEQTTTGPDGIYAYDAAGNRSGAGFAANNLNQYTAFNGFTFAYDSRGNTTAITAPTPTPPPVITTQPAPKTVTAGQTATFSVVATGAAPLSYQWRKNGGNIANAIAASYTTPATTLADNSALFSVLVSNPGGSTLSNNDTLTVNPAPTPTPTPSNKVLPVTFNPNSLAHGTHPISSYRVYLQTQTPGAVIYWTHNRTTPVPGNGTTFKINSNYGPVDIPGGAIWTLEAMAVKSGMTNSDVTTSGTYDNTDPGTAPPPAPGGSSAQTAGFAITGTASYSYDAQNRLRSATVNGVTESFLYDGLNRKFSQTIDGITTVNVWDGWDLIQEYNSGSTVANYSYVYGPTGILERLDGGGANPIFYFQDALGNTAYITDGNANMIELYQYDRFGNVTVYGPGGALRPAPSYDIRHLYTGQLWMPQIGLYDLRNRVYSPTLQRFMQTDPIGFGGDVSNLYRYTSNNGVYGTDPTGEYGKVTRNSDGSYIVTIPIYYTGPGVTDAVVARYANGIASLSGNYGGIDVTFQATRITDITFGNWWRGDYNSVTVKAGFGQDSGFGYSRGSLSSFGEGTWRADGGSIMINGTLVEYSPEYGASHEVFHFMGFIDGYDPQTGKLKDGVTNSDILSNSNYGRPTVAEVMQILFNGGGNGGYGIYDSKGNGYYIYDTNGNPGDYVGQTTNGGTILAGVPFGLGGSFFQSYSSYTAYQIWGGSTQSRIPVTPDHPY